MGILRCPLTPNSQEIVEDVCGSVRTRCAIALGDWNVDAAGVMGGSFNSWERLVGGNPPVFVVPNWETCCHPSTCCRFDHLATNLPDALPVHVKVWEYQLLDQFSIGDCTLYCAASNGFGEIDCGTKFGVNILPCYLHRVVF